MVFLLPPSIEFHFRLNRRPEVLHGRTIECLPTVIIVGPRSHALAFSVTQRANEYATLQARRMSRFECYVHSFVDLHLELLCHLWLYVLYPPLQVMKSHFVGTIFDTKA